MINFLIFILLSPSDIYKEARKAYESGDFALAGKKFERILVNYPEDKLIPEVLYWAARVKNDPIKAIEYYRKIVFMYPDNNFAVEALYNVAQYYYALEDYGEAVKAYNEIISKYPSTECAKLAQEWEAGIVSLAYIQIAAFSGKVNASKFKKYMEDSLYKNPAIKVPVQVIESPGCYKVTIGPFASEEQATKFMSANNIKGFIAFSPKK